MGRWVGITGWFHPEWVGDMSRYSVTITLGESLMKVWGNVEKLLGRVERFGSVWHMRQECG